MEKSPNTNGSGRFASKLVTSSTFLMSFLGVTIAAAVAGFYSSKPVAVIAFPILACLPFLIVINLHWASQARMRVSEAGAPMFSTLLPPAFCCLTIVLLLWGALHMLLFRSP